MLVDSETPERRFGLQIREQEDPAHLGSSYTSDASSIFSSQGYDSPQTNFSSRATSPSLSHVSGKTRSSSEQAYADDEHGTASAPPLKKYKLDSQGAGEKAVATARPCAEQNKKERTVMHINRALLVDNLVDVTVKTIGSVWGRFSRESQCQLPAQEGKQHHANSTLPLDLFVREILPAIVVASKFLQDRTYSNRTWSKISGLPTKEVEQIERVFLHAIEYDLVVEELLWTSWTQELASRWNRTKDIPSESTIKAFKCSPKMQGARLQRAFSENVLGQALPFDSGLTNARLPRIGFARHETMS
ncbi:hypothetical protein MVES_001050 [Malassezia vespertilionis]|uniref:Cyclin N-terminal domain-containing protein n=1 Tax=Malassezia vespertilionis TaxID=2020962 RepID=A0A2N1JE82_9BASI|nr:hypothetical protein MVES_001050 [Malassezia vespertilionis]